MLHKYVTQTSQTCDTEKLENALVSACSGGLQITHRLELRRLVTSLWYDVEMNKHEISNQQEAVTIIRSLIDRIEITPGEKRGDPQV